MSKETKTTKGTNVVPADELLNLRKVDYAGCLYSKDEYVGMVDQFFCAPVFMSSRAFDSHVKTGLPGLWDVLLMSHVSPGKTQNDDFGYVFEFYAANEKKQRDVAKFLRVERFRYGVAIIMPSERIGHPCAANLARMETECREYFREMQNEYGE